jgi:N-acetyltransferase
VTNRNNKTKASLNKAAAPSDQLQIDAGQKVIGPLECSNCGMVYDIGDPVDEKRHADYHAKRHELKYKVD